MTRALDRLETMSAQLRRRLDNMEDRGAADLERYAIPSLHAALEIVAGARASRSSR